MVFQASLDKMAKRITAGTAVLFALNVFFFLPSLEHGAYFVLIGISLLLVSIYVGSYLFRTTAYEIKPTQLIIRRPFKDKILTMSDITRVERLEAGALNRSTRLFGSGGLFGYYGKFSNAKFGYMTWYATNRANPVILHMTGGKKLLITPDDPGAFISAFSSSGVPSERVMAQHA